MSRNDTTPSAWVMCTPGRAWASPTRHDEIEAAAAAMADHDLEFVVLDCMAHNEAYREELARLCGRPVVAAQTLVAHVVGALVG